MKRSRPRPNQITVNLSPELRGKLDECVSHLRTTTGDPFYSTTELVRHWIEAAHQAVTWTKSKNNSKN